MWIFLGLLGTLAAGAFLSYLYHGAVIADLQHLKAAAEKERDELKAKYNELIERLRTK